MLPQVKNHTLKVDPTTGGLTLQVVDLIIPAIGFDFVFQRFYDSLSVLGLHHGCSFPFDERLKFDPDGSVRLIIPGEAEYRFLPGTYAPSISSNHQTLTRDSDGYWTVTFQSKERHVYRPDGRMVKKIDTFGNTMSYAWNTGVGDDATLISITDASHRVITMTGVNVDGIFIQTFTDWTGRSWVYEGNFVRKYTDPMGNVTIYDYNETRSDNFFPGPSRVTLPDGTVWYDAQPVGPSPVSNKVASITFANGLVVTYTYDYTSSPLKTTVDEGGRTTIYEYDADFNITKKTDSIGNVWTYEYDSDDNLTLTTDPLLHTLPQTWDTNGNMLTRTNQLGNTWTYAYESLFNKVSQITDPTPFSYTTKFVYDSTTGALLTLTDRNNKDTTYEHWDNGLLKKMTDPNANTVQYGYNGFGNLTSLTDGRGKVTTMKYDSVGNLINTVDPLGRSMTRTFDRNSNLLTMTDALGNTVSLSYDSRQRVVAVQDPLGRTTQFTYGPLDEVISVRDAMGNLVTHSYDQWLNGIKLTNANNQSWEFTFDDLDRTREQVDPLGRATSWNYDPFCDTFTRVDPNGWSTKTYRDGICHVTRVEYNDGSFVNFEYDELNRRTKMTQPGKRYNETKFGAVTYGTLTSDDITYDYDPMGRMTSVTYPGGNVVAMGYDDGGRLQTLTDINSVDTTYVYYGNNSLHTATRDSKTVTYDLDDAGQVTSMTLPNGVVGTMTYDDAGRVTGIDYVNASADSLLALTYAYDRNGSRTQKTIARSAGTPVVHDYDYDALGRLVSSKWDGRYVYDPNGNRLARITDGADTPSSYDAADELITQGNVALEWTPKGELAARRDPVAGTTSYRFGYQELLETVTLPDATTAEYRYFGIGTVSGLRKQKTDNTGTTTHHIWAPFGLPTMINELDGTGTTKASYLLAGGLAPAGIVVEGTNRWTLTDALGSVLALTDDSGSVTDTYEFSDFGVETAATGGSYNPFRFTGQYNDGEASLTYMRARYYDAGLQRFVSRDVVQGSNRYAYADSRPTALVDPSGLQGIPFPINQGDAPAQPPVPLGPAPTPTPNPCNPERHSDCVRRCELVYALGSIVNVLRTGGTVAALTLSSPATAGTSLIGTEPVLVAGAAGQALMYAAYRACLARCP